MRTLSRFQRNSEPPEVQVAGRDLIGDGFEVGVDECRASFETSVGGPGDGRQKIGGTLHGIGQPASGGIDPAAMDECPMVEKIAPSISLVGFPPSAYSIAFTVLSSSGSAAG